MVLENTQADQLAEIISHSIAPSFLLGAVSGFVAVLTGRMNSVIDRSRAINAIPDTDADRTHLKADLPRLKRRAKLLNEAIYLAVGSAICTTALVITAFGSAFIGRRHEVAVAVMFVSALVLMCASLVKLAQETRIGLNEHDHIG